MLKYKANETLTWTIDGVNDEFVSDNYIALVDSIIVDWLAVTAYTIDRYSITLDVAPVTSIVLNHFYREELDIVWNWLVEFWDITQEIYDELWRSELSKVYKKERVESMINKSLKRIINKSPEKSKIQHYALKWLNGMKVESVTSDSLWGSAIQWVDVEWAMLVWDNIYLPYTDYDGSTFTTQLQDVVDVGDQVIVGHRIPYWVQKVSEIYVDWYKLEYVDSRDFCMTSIESYTIIRGKDGNEYLFLPYSETEYTLSVKYVPDQKIMVNETDIVDIESEYTTVIAYDVLYRLTGSREDERSNYWYRELYWDWGRNAWLLTEYRSFKANQLKKNRARIGFASPYQRKPTRTTDEIPNGLY